MVFKAKGIGVDKEKRRSADWVQEHPKLRGQGHTGYRERGWEGMAGEGEVNLRECGITEAQTGKFLGEWESNVPCVYLPML